MAGERECPNCAVMVDDGETCDICGWKNDRSKNAAGYLALHTAVYNV